MIYSIVFSLLNLGARVCSVIFTPVIYAFESVTGEIDLANILDTVNSFWSTCFSYIHVAIDMLGFNHLTIVLLLDLLSIKLLFRPALALFKFIIKLIVNVKMIIMP